MPRNLCSRESRGAVRAEDEDEEVDDAYAEVYTVLKFVRRVNVHAVGARWGAANARQ